MIGTVAGGRLRARLPLPQPLRRRAREPRVAALRIVPRHHRRARCDACSPSRSRRSPSSPSSAGRSSPARSTSSWRARARRAGAPARARVPARARPGRRRHRADHRRAARVRAARRPGRRRPAAHGEDRAGARAQRRGSRSLVTWLGLALAYFTNYSVGFYVTSLAFAVYLIARARRQFARRPDPGVQPGAAGILA